MLNYIWIGLIVIGILTAAGYDARNEFARTYRNGDPIETPLQVEHGSTSVRSGSEVILTIPASTLNAFYGIRSVQEEVRQPATIYNDSAGASTIIIPIGDGSPAIWK
jgi:hypothetical protein